MIRILKITGHSDEARRARLQRIEPWMAARGWRLADYSQEARSAVFERPDDAPPLRWLDATRWLPAPRSWKPGELLHFVWADPRWLVLPGVVVVLLIVLGLALFAPSSFDAEDIARRQAQQNWFYVVANQLNVREAPGRNAQTVGVLYRDQRVLVEGVVDETWARIEVPLRGYVARAYLSGTPTPKRPGQPPSGSPGQGLARPGRSSSPKPPSLQPSARPPQRPKREAPPQTSPQLPVPPPAKLPALPPVQPPLLPPKLPASQ